MKLSDLVEIKVGTSVYRLKQEVDANYIECKVYREEEILKDALETLDEPNVNTYNFTEEQKYQTVKAGDIVFSAISGIAAIVSKEHDGYVITQNCLKITPIKEVDSNYLVFLLNEDRKIKKQYANMLQGSLIFRYNANILRDLQLPKLLSLENQKIVGKAYLINKKISLLKRRKAKNEMKRIEAILKEVR